jgi:hypothetical protein
MTRIKKAGILPVLLALFGALALTGCDSGSSTVFQALDGLANWQAVANNIIGDNIQTVAYGNDVFVAGSYAGSGDAAYSIDGVNWVSRDGTATTFGTNSFNRIRFLNNKFYAVGSAGTMAWTSNGVTWTAITQSEINGKINDIAYGKEMLIIVGDGGAMAYSEDDGGNWTSNNQTSIFKHSGGGAVNINSIVYAAGKFMAVGQSGTAAVSFDGKTWANAGPGEEGTHAIFGNATSGSNGIKMVAYGNGIFVVVGQAKAAVSVDGGVWTKIDLTPLLGSPGSTSWLNCVNFINGRFVAGGGNGQLVYSYNGVYWIKPSLQTQAIFGSNNYINGVAYGGGRYVAVAQSDNAIAYTVP